MINASILLNVQLLTFPA